ncbi:centrosomal protein of 19 kDa-like [Orbicella faveolata]|uniref:centrosomal protein of 19 kDa-like n=1 Tax=Orbicella faveolata TaxID=48498 RepID=UPI0009E4307E|nr:centrosomal protein of 19 kDa-like [Orbicella faveolata]
MTLSAVLQIVGSECSKRQQCDFKCTSLRPNGFRENKVKMFTPRKCGVKFDPPTLVVYYEVKRTGKLHKRSMPIRKLNKDSSIPDVVTDLKKSSNHGKYLEDISHKQLENLLTMIQNKMNGKDPIQLKDSALRLKSSPNNSDQEEDLNKLDDYELDKRKADMDKDFEKNRIKPGDEDFVYDKEVEFNEGKIESGWDDDDEYSDPEF